MPTHRAPNTLDEIARLVHENEALRRENARLTKALNVYRGMLRSIRNERNELRAKLAARSRKDNHGPEA